MYTDKLTIEISDEGGGGGGEEADQQQGSSGSFDPDTLERNLDRDRRQQARPGGAAPGEGTQCCSSRDCLPWTTFVLHPQSMTSLHFGKNLQCDDRNR